MIMYADPLASPPYDYNQLRRQLSYGRYGTFLASDGAKQEGRT